MGKASALRVEREAMDKFLKKIPHFGGPQMGRNAAPKLWAVSICFIQQIIKN